MSPLKLAIAVLLSATLFSLSSSSNRGDGRASHLQHAALEKLPKQMIWAWQRPEDLRWLPADAGVAYVAASIALENDRADVLPRMHPLRVRPETAVVPVVHVDASWRQPPGLSIAQQDAIVDALVNAAQLGNRKVVQLDFEVRRSQRAFLAAVVTEARRRLPSDTALSVTALASWCAGDHWLGALPADEIVPMAFRMASGDADIRKLLADEGGFKPAHCQNALGTAIDEPAIALHSSATPRRYHFSPRPWTQQLWGELQWQMQKIR